MTIYVASEVSCEIHTTNYSLSVAGKPPVADENREDGGA